MSTAVLRYAGVLYRRPDFKLRATPHVLVSVKCFIVSVLSGRRTFHSSFAERAMSTNAELA